MNLAAPYFQERLWITLGALALGLASGRAVKTHLQAGAPPGVAALAALALFFVLVSRSATPTGDEPHYLIMVQSLLQEGDFELRGNYENRDYSAYYPDVIPDPHVILRGEEWYPVHAIGLPILAAPFYALGGRLGVLVLLALLTVAGLRVLWSLLRIAGFGLPATAAATGVAGLTLPVAVMAGQAFPEIPAFLLVAVALRAIITPRPSRGEDLGFLVGVALLPWLHPKYAALSGALLLSLALVRGLRRTRATLLGATSLLIFSVLGHAFLSYRWYGAPLPGAPILVAHGPSPTDWIPSILGHFFVTPWVGLLGVLFDQQSGLFVASPVYVMAVPGAVWLWRGDRALAAACGLIFASVYLPAGSFGVWYGGYSSPARLLTPTVPVLAVGLAGVLSSGHRLTWKLFAVLAAPSVLHAVLMTALPSYTRYGDPLTDHNFLLSRLERMSGLDLTWLFPSFRDPEPATWLTAAGYILAIVALSAVLLRRRVVPHVP